MLKMKLVLLLAFFFVAGALARPGSEEKSKEQDGSGEKKKSGEVIAKSQENLSGEKDNDSSCEDSGSNESGKSNESKRSVANSDEDSSSKTNSDESNSAEAGDTSDVNPPQNNALSNQLINDLTEVSNAVEKSSAFHFLQQINPLRIALKIPILGQIIRAIISIICIPIKFIPYMLNAISRVFDEAPRIVPGV